MITTEFQPIEKMGISLIMKEISFNYETKYNLLCKSTLMGYAIIINDKREDGYHTIKYFLLEDDVTSFDYKPMFDGLTGKLTFIDIKNVKRK